MKLGYLEFVEVLRKQLLNALHLQEQQIFFKKKTSLDKGTQRKTTENELPSLTQCTA